MAFLPQRDQPLPKGLVHGITSIVFESALVLAEPPKQPAKTTATAPNPAACCHNHANPPIP